MNQLREVTQIWGYVLERKRHVLDRKKLLSCWKYVDPGHVLERNAISAGLSAGYGNTLEPAQGGFTIKPMRKGSFYGQAHATPPVFTMRHTEITMKHMPHVWLWPLWAIARVLDRKSWFELHGIG